MSIVPMVCSTHTATLVVLESSAPSNSVFECFPHSEMALATVDPMPTAAPKRASLWLVDENGVGIGKPLVLDLPIAEVHGVYYHVTQTDGIDPKKLRIADAGKRPDSLGYRR